jgi:hypothetical protein
LTNQLHLLLLVGGNGAATSTFPRLVQESIRAATPFRKAVS